MMPPAHDAPFSLDFFLHFSAAAARFCFLSCRHHAVCCHAYAF